MISSPIKNIKKQSIQNIKNIKLKRKNMKKRNVVKRVIKEKESTYKMEGFLAKNGS